MLSTGLWLPYADFKYIIDHLQRKGYYHKGRKCFKHTKFKINPELYFYMNAVRLHISVKFHMIHSENNHEYLAKLKKENEEGAC